MFKKNSCCWNIICLDHLSKVISLFSLHIVSLTVAPDTDYDSWDAVRKEIIYSPVHLWCSHVRIACPNVSSPEWNLDSHCP